MEWIDIKEEHVENMTGNRPLLDNICTRFIDGYPRIHFYIKIPSIVFLEGNGLSFYKDCRILGKTKMAFIVCTN